MRNGEERIIGTHSILLVADGVPPSEGRFTCVDISTVHPHMGSAKLILEYSGKRLEVKANDFFAALQLIRLQLEPEGLTPCVNGACVDVYPSGMARDMGFGLTAYRLFPGKPWGDLDDLVGIFDADALSRLVSVAEQKAYFQQWFNALTKDN